MSKGLNKNIAEDVYIAWRDFIADKGIADATIAEYYRQTCINDSKDTRGIDSSGIARIAYEVLQDLVAMGMVSLPDGVTVEGLSLDVSNGWRDGLMEIDGEVLVLSTRNYRARRGKTIVDDRPYIPIRNEFAVF